MPSQQTLKEINHINRRFWSDQRELLDRRMADSAIRESAFENMRAQQLQGLPIFFQTCIEKALEDAERVGRRFIVRQARKRGIASKTDVLQLIIEEIVRRQPSITARRLIEILRERQGIAPIEDIDDGTIWFTNHDDRSKEANISGLKDRLSRAKAKYQSR